MLKSLLKLLTDTKKAVSKEEFLSSKDNAVLANNTEIVEYINSVFEKLERERLFRWFVNSIRDSLNLETILQTSVNEVGKLLGADRCLIALFTESKEGFYFKSEYLSDKSISSKLTFEINLRTWDQWDNAIRKNKQPIIINHIDHPLVSDEQKQLCKEYDVKSIAVIPLIYKESALGALIVEQVTYQREWVDDHIDFLKDIASQVAIAINQAELYSLTKKQAQKEAFIRKITETIRSSSDIDKSLQTICKEVSELINCPIVHITETSIKGNYKEWTLRASIGSTEANLATVDARGAEFWFEYLFKKEGILNISNIDTADVSPYFSNNCKILGIKSILGIAVKKDSHNWGAIMISDTVCRKWTQDEISILESLAAQVYIVTKQAKQHQIIKEQAERESALRKISETIRSSLDIEEVKYKIVKEIAKTFKADRCFIRLYNPDGKYLPVDTEYINHPSLKSIKGATFKNGIDEETRKIQLQNKPVIMLENEDFCNNKEINEAAKRIFKGLEVKSIYGIPIFYNEELIGAFILQWIEKKAITDRQIELLKTIANQAGIAIKHAELYSITKKQAERERLLRGLLISSSTLDYKEAIKSVVSQTGKLFNADRCFFVNYHYESKNNLPVEDFAVYLSSLDIKDVTGRVFTQEEIAPFTHRIIDKREIMAISDINTLDLPEITTNLLHELSVKSFLACPLICNGKIVGRIILHFVNQQREFTEADTELLAAIASQSGKIIHHARLYNQTEEAINRESVVRHVSEKIRNSLDTSETLHFICKEVSELFNVTRTGIGDFTNKISGKYLMAEYKSTDKVKGLIDVAIDSRILDYLYENVVKPDMILTIDNVDESDIPDYFKEHQYTMNIKSGAYIPLKDDDNKGWGIMVLTQHYSQHTWTMEEIDLLRIIGDQVSIAIRQANLYTQAQQAARLKSEFIATMSHEFRTPLNAIIGFSEMIQTGKYGEFSEKGLNFLKNINICGKHLLNLVNDILDISKFEAGEVKLEYRLFNSTDVIIESVDTLKNLAQNKNTVIDLQLADVEIEADMVKFKQMIYNLLSNAIKFTPTNGTIRIKSALNKDKLVVMVEDTGIGIDSKDYDKIFAEFKQVDSSYTRIQNGSGLGLSLTKKFVELHNGTIHFESELGKGSRFWFILPKAQPTFERDRRNCTTQL